jgi:hypothetical protein
MYRAQRRFIGLSYPLPDEFVKIHYRVPSLICIALAGALYDGTIVLPHPSNLLTAPVVPDQTA